VIEPLNLRSLIWLLMIDWSKRENINTAALVTIVQCNTLVARCSRQFIGPAVGIFFVTLGPEMILGHLVTGSMGHLGHLSRPGHWVIILTKMQNVQLKCWNDKSHCQVSVGGMKSPDVSPSNQLLLLPMIIKHSLAPLHISRHLEFIIEQGHRVNWVSGSLDSRVTGSQNLTPFHVWLGPLHCD